MSRIALLQELMDVVKAKQETDKSRGLLNLNLADFELRVHHKFGE
jgi:hypothetical protein